MTSLTLAFTAAAASAAAAAVATFPSPFSGTFFTISELVSPSPDFSSVFSPSSFFSPSLKHRNRKFSNAAQINMSHVL